MQRVPVAPDGDGIVSVRHRFGMKRVVIKCFRADGSEVGYLMDQVIGPGEIEVATVPGSGVAVIEVEPFEELSASSLGRSG